MDDKERDRVTMAKERVRGIIGGMIDDMYKIYSKQIGPLPWEQLGEGAFISLAHAWWSV